MPLLDVQFDGFARSVIDTKTRRSCATVIRPWRELLAGEFASTSQWNFNWLKETRVDNRNVHGLLLRRSNRIEGLVSLEPASDHVFVHLLESAPHNRGPSKLFEGVPGNLVAFACAVSFNAGHRGHLALDAKTELINHYEETLGAIRVGSGTRMILDEPAADELIRRCYGKADQWPV